MSDQDGAGAFAEGVAAGADISKQAGQCPYLPHKDGPARKAWLAGFASSRPTASPASNPERARNAGEPSGYAPESPLPPNHIG